MPSNHFQASQHNHQKCVADAMHKARSVCEQHGLRFTPIRQQVLELIWAQHAPISAYDLLKDLRLTKSNAEAPTVYRALDFLIRHGLAHKVESLNAYVGCEQPQHKHPSQFLICLKCQQIVELEDTEIASAITRHGINNHFMITEQIIELKGYCSICKP